MSGSAFSSQWLWYATRSTGIVAFLLLSVTLVLGVAATQRALASRRWPRFATQDLHRNVSLLAMAMLLIHIVTTLVDAYVKVGWWSLVVPLTSSYERFGVALGTTGFDVLLAVVVTSLLRTRMSVRTWRLVHWASYVAWPLALLHFVLTGTDASHARWGLWLGLGAIVPVAATVALRLRLRSSDAPRGQLGSVTGGGL